MLCVCVFVCVCVCMCVCFTAGTVILSHTVCERIRNYMTKGVWCLEKQESGLPTILPFYKAVLFQHHRI